MVLGVTPRLVLGLRCSRTGCCRLPFTVQKARLTQMPRFSLDTQHMHGWTSRREIYCLVPTTRLPCAWHKWHQQFCGEASSGSRSLRRTDSNSLCRPLQPRLLQPPVSFSHYFSQHAGNLRNRRKVLAGHRCRQAVASRCGKHGLRNNRRLRCSTAGLREMT